MNICYIYIYLDRYLTVAGVISHQGYRVLQPKRKCCVGLIVQTCKVKGSANDSIKRLEVSVLQREDVLADQHWNE